VVDSDCRDVDHTRADGLDAYGEQRLRALGISSAHAASASLACGAKNFISLPLRRKKNALLPSRLTCLGPGRRRSAGGRHAGGSRVGLAAGYQGSGPRKSKLFFCARVAARYQRGKIGEIVLQWTIHKQTVVPLAYGHRVHVRVRLRLLVCRCYSHVRTRVPWYSSTYVRACTRLPFSLRPRFTGTQRVRPTSSYSGPGAQVTGVRQAGLLGYHLLVYGTVHERAGTDRERAQ
jgi:hypothetical protein